MPSPERKFQDLSRFEVPARFRGRSGITVQVWWLVQALLFAPSPQFLYGWRAFLLKRFGARIGKGVKIRPSARITYPWKVDIGDNVWIGDRAELYSLVSIQIGSDSCISQDCYLCTGAHDHRQIDFRYDCRPIMIDSEVWLAAGTFVGPGVSVGRGVVVGARSLVLRDLDAETLYAGVPAKRLGPRPIAGTETPVSA